MPQQTGYGVVVVWRVRKRSFARWQPAIAPSALILTACSVQLTSGSVSSDAQPCTRTEDCPPSGSPCFVSTCYEGSCWRVAAAEHDVLATQRPGDCQMLECDGAGNVRTTTDDLDAPPEDGDACTTEGCDDGLVTRGYADAGETCGDGGVCNGKGRCGACIPGARNCNGARPNQCSELGEWTPTQACAGAKPLCHEGRCLVLVALAAGGASTCAMFNDPEPKNGARWTCLGSLMPARLPPGVATLDNTMELAIGGDHACALTKGGAIACAGLNGEGQLGDRSLQNRATFGEVPSVTRATTVAAGAAHSCAIAASEGRVLCWGNNSHGQLGRGSASGKPAALTPSAPPVAFSQRSLGVDAAALAVGGAGACVLLGKGNVVCSRTRDQAAFAAPPKAAARVRVAEAEAKPVLGIKGAKAIAAGSAHSCAIVAEGRVRCWGRGDRGQLGDGSSRSSALPVDVKDLEGAVSIALGHDFSCAVVAGGIRCWGANDAGQLGDGSNVDRAAPVEVAGMSGSKMLTAGGAHACALNASGAASCWGDRAAFSRGRGAANRAAPLEFD